MLIDSLVRPLIKFMGIGLSILLISGCGGSETPPCRRTEDACLIQEPQIDIWWDAPIIDFSSNLNRPTISLLGDRTLLLSLGEFYQEQGAIAIDEQDGDISSSITIQGQVNTNQVGDYLIRYSVTDSSNTVAIEQIRIVRVYNNNAQQLSRRPLGSTIANFGYFEHLPVNYGMPLDEKPPLLIYLHGSGANLEFTTDTDPLSSLDAVLNHNGIPRIIADDEWDNALPFVVLAPHLGTLPDLGYKERLDAFVKYALHTYDIDVNRVYLTGWSSGGYLSSAYAVDFPDKIAAIAPIASGLSTSIENLPAHFCNIEKVPVWLFHGTNDLVTPFTRSVDAYNAILDQCQARVLPKLSLLLRARHHMHHAVFDLTALAGGQIDGVDVEYDARFDAYDLSIYQWLLSHSLKDR